MRNDARPIGEDAPSSPVGGSESARDIANRESVVNRDDSRDVNRDNSRRVNRGAEDDERRVNRAAVNKESTLSTKI